jgi:hypothetical protein
MSVTLPQYQNIKEFLTGNPAGGYEEWVNQYKPKKVKKSIEPHDDKGFKKFWDIYPSTANFSIRGMKFISSRVLRSNYQVCEQLYNKALADNTSLTADKIIRALQLHLSISKKEAYETGKNTLQFWPGIEVYLRQGKYEGFIMNDEDVEMGFTTNDDYESDEEERNSNSA